jgi:hypothetical protein
MAKSGSGRRSDTINEVVVIERAQKVHHCPTDERRFGALRVVLAPVYALPAKPGGLAMTLTPSRLIHRQLDVGPDLSGLRR